MKVNTFLTNAIAVLAIAVHATHCRAEAEAPPRLYNLGEMPKVDVHVHIWTGDAALWDSYLESIDKVGIAVAINLSGNRQTVANAAQIHAKYNHRLLYAPHCGRIANGVWWSDDDLEAFVKAGAAGCKWMIAWQDHFDTPQIIAKIRRQGELGLPVLGYHIATVPSGSTDIDKFWDWNRRAIKVIAACPKTTFIMAHGFFLMVDDEKLDVLDGYFRQYPNLYVDIGAAEQFWNPPEPDHRKLRDFIIAWKDRILFATDGSTEMSVNPCLINNFFRILETDQRNLGGYFGGNIDGLELPLDVLNYIYWWNAVRVIPRVKESLLAQGHRIDEKIPHVAPPLILDTNVQPVGGKVRITATTDKPAFMRWSLSKKRYALMQPDKPFAIGEGATRHSFDLIPAAGLNTVYLSARGADGMEMPTAVPVAFEEGIRKDIPGPAERASDYRLVCREKGAKDAGFAVKESFREVYLRFESNAGSGALWTFMFQPNPKVEAEESVSTVLSSEGIATAFSIEKRRSFSGPCAKTGAWRKHEVRLNLDRNLYVVEVDGVKVIESRDQDLATTWGGDLDTIVFAAPVRDVLIVTGPRASGFADSGTDDSTPPLATWIYPAPGDTHVLPDAPVLVELTDPGIGVSPGSIAMTCDGDAVTPVVFGDAARRMLAFRPQGGFQPGKTVALTLGAADAWIPPNAMAQSKLQFTVGAPSVNAHGTNLALKAPVKVDSVYDRGYDERVITDGVIDANPGKGNTWGSKDSAGSQPHWVETDLGGERTVKAVRIHWAATDKGSMAARVLTVQAADKDGFRTIGAAFTPQPAASTTVSFNPVRTSRIRITQPVNMGPATYHRTMWLTEIEVLGD